MNPLAADDWANRAATLPVAFAQVREDPLIDMAVLDSLGRGDLRVVMIASGGCTAALLAASGQVGELHLVDANAAQVALARLKLRLLQTADTAGRLRTLGHAPEPGEGPSANLGADHAGRYEVCFAELRKALEPQQAELTALLSLSDPAEQSRRARADTPLGRALDDALDRIMSLPNLVALFGDTATQNARQPFSRHFAARTRAALATFPANENPWLWQMLLGRFPPAARYPWLDAPAPASMPRLQFVHAPMDEALAAYAGGGADFVHLSNILDWLTPDQARHTLARAADALRPGGVTLIRQLNSTLDVPALGPQFEWDERSAAALHARDRSFFYHALHLGRRR